MNWQRRKTPKGLPKAKRHKPKFQFSMELQEQLIADTRAKGQPVDYIIGIDEVGWGAIAGPLVLGCVVLRPDQHLGVKDSKAYSTERAREKAAQVVMTESEYRNVFAYSAHRMDLIGASAARDIATRVLANEALSEYPNSLVVIDGNYIPDVVKDMCIAVPKADRLIQAVSAASVIAKVSRDTYMRNITGGDDYDFYQNKGYATPQHIKLLKALGPCDEHRRYTSSVQAVLNGKEED